MKFALLLLIAASLNHRNLVVNSKQPHPSASPFVGGWSWTPNKSEVFLLNIKQVGNKLIGSYCDVFDYGKKMDCGDPEDTSFIIPVPSKNSVVASFVSSYSHAKGKVKLTISDNELTWKILKRPVRENYSPDFVVMKKN